MPSAPWRRVGMERILKGTIHGSVSKPWYLVNPKIAGKWMFIPLKMVSIGIDPYLHHQVRTIWFCLQRRDFSWPSFFRRDNDEEAVSVVEVTATEPWLGWGMFMDVYPSRVEGQPSSASALPRKIMSNLWKGIWWFNIIYVRKLGEAGFSS